jgi:hypothetical protein
MDFIRHHWYDLGVVSGIAILRYYRANYRTLSMPQKLLIANFVALLAHQFEEYRFPGGFPAVMNVAVHESKNPDRYPLNADSAMITNVISTYGVYLPVIFLPQVAWFGLSSVLFGFAQVWIHGIMMNMKLGQLYNPGLISVVVGFVPIGFRYIRYMQDHGLLTTRDWILGFLGAFVQGLFLLKFTFGTLPDINTPYPFHPSELQRWGARIAGLA